MFILIVCSLIVAIFLISISSLFRRRKSVDGKHVQRWRTLTIARIVPEMTAQPQAQTTNIQLIDSNTRQLCSARQLLDPLLNNSKPITVFFGEYHNNSQILQAQLSVFHAILCGSRDPVALVLEMFNYQQQQPLIDRFMSGQISLAELQREYNQSSEGFDIIGHYGQLLLCARSFAATVSNRTVKVRAGFVPRPMAARLAKCKSMEEENGLLDELASNGHCWQKMVDIYRRFPGTDRHYAHFSSLLTDDGLPDRSGAGKFRQIFKAQLLKDASMAAVIRDFHENEGCLGSASVVYAVCGSGHSDYRDAVPERLPPQGHIQLNVSAKSEEFLRQNFALSEICDAVFPFADDA